ncbi:MAG: metallophosphoesterase [Gluconobacter potus]|uniref:metallophosphoesterase n=1 Tax=Acetobacteraceae TaxID=433 RepID=UPI00094F6E06|nr:MULTISPECIES: metallophosphoesterase [Acetobacteraceae]WEQ54917.1 metallophosphoesterase [Komagataeibacter nataicola]
MRIFALSDLHVDYSENMKWVSELSTSDFLADILIVAGDISDIPTRLRFCLENLARKFFKILYLPGNHDLWVIRDQQHKTSFEKFHEVLQIAAECGASTGRFVSDGLCIVPLFGWYDYSFGTPSSELKSAWMDFHACRWPEGFEVGEVAAHFAALNDLSPPTPGEMIITYSHFVPRVDLLPLAVRAKQRWLLPVLGTTRLEKQLRMVGARLHIYGHSHLQQRVEIDGVRYLNNAFGYPHETWIASRGLQCVYVC